MLKRFITYIFLAYTTVVSAEEILLLDNRDISLILRVSEEASVAETDWLHFSLINKSPEDIKIEKLVYHINGFDRDAEGRNRFVKAKYGTANHMQMIHWFYDQPDMMEASRNFRLAAGEEIGFWKYPSSKTSVMFETSLAASGEICALMEVEFEYTRGDYTEELHSEEAFCTNWVKLNSVDRKKLAEGFSEILLDGHIQHVHSQLLATMCQMPGLVNMISDSVLVEAVISRSKAQSSSERMFVLHALKLKSAFDHPRIIEHYRQIIPDKKYRWEDDFQIYWSNALLDDLMESHMYVKNLALILELHASSWSSDSVLIEKVFSYLVEELNFDFDEKLDRNNFRNWYNDVKYLATGRHPKLVNYFSELLENETFFPVLDWSAVESRKIIQQEDRNKAKMIYFRVCDVAYVCLLRTLDLVKMENTFVRNKIKPDIFIDPKWEGENPDARKAIQLINPYTILKPNLQMAEKYYYYFDNNKAAIQKLIREYEAVH